MRNMNYRKYVPYPPVGLIDRTWPDKVITHSPVWCSIDLRDGNQALSVPMNTDEKMTIFELLVSIGFKEIEVGFPSASDTEYRFVRQLIEEQRIPDDVTIQVLTQAREHLIKRTFEAVRGAENVIIHLYNSTSRNQREIVFRKDKEGVKNIALEAAALIMNLRNEEMNDGMRFEYTPESFTGTELDYALEVCQSVITVWRQSISQKIIINLPATVEMSTPNIYADRIEWFCRHIQPREAVIISVHTHNDRGSAVAAAELAMMAGAERVEGSLFGNGERSGNMDVITMALNLFSQGVDPQLDFSDIKRISEVYQECTGMEIHPRHPYAGELVYTAFSGSHQDAINKGMKNHVAGDRGIWDVPYLPIDPQDVGRTYEAIIRINSQSGKGGVAYVLEKEFGIQLPKWMQPDFGRIVQVAADKTGRELTPNEIFTYFENEYLELKTPYTLKNCHIDMSAGGTEGSTIKANVETDGQDMIFQAQGNGPVDAFVKGLIAFTSNRFSLNRYAEHAIGHGSDAKAVAYVNIVTERGEYFGAGIDENIGIATIKAVISALNRSKEVP